MGILRKATVAKYRTHLVHASLRDSELDIDWVRFRVLVGGHDIADADVRRRYGRSLARVSEALRSAESAIVLDNLEFQPLRMLMVEGGCVVWQAGALPEWFRRLMQML